MASTLTDGLGWLVILLFSLPIGYAVLQRVVGDREFLTASSLNISDHSVVSERVTASSGWALFAVFWALLFPHFAFTQKSYVEGVLTLLAVPACLYTGWLLWQGRDSLQLLSRAVGAMGLVYFPFASIEALERGLIMVVTRQTGWAMGLLGYTPEPVDGPILGYPNAYQFVTPEGHALIFEIVLACTGLGSMAIFAGLVAAVDAPLYRKARALLISIPVIWVLNVARTTFIGITFGNQYLHVFADEILFLFGSADPYMVSFFLSDRIISQVLAVVALVGLNYLVLRELPELTTVVEDILYIFTATEYDLEAALDLSTEERVQ